MEYEVHEKNIGQLEKQLGRLVKRATKLGVAPVTVVVGPARLVEDPKLPGSFHRFHTVTVDGQAPRINGWDFLASVHHNDDGENIVRSAIGFNVQTSVYTARPVCEHCQTNRFRNLTFFLRHDTSGQLKQVGSTCVRDFLGHNCPHNIAAFAETVLSVHNLCDAARDINWLGGGKLGSSWSHRMRASLPVFLDYCAAAALTYGFKGRKDAPDGVTTARVAFDSMFVPKDSTSFALVTVTPEATKLAEAAREWIILKLSPELYEAQTDDPDDVKTEVFSNLGAARAAKPLNDFESSLLSVAHQEVIEVRGSGGIASWIIGYYLREQAQIAQAKVNGSDFVGQLKERLTLTLTVTDVIYTNTIYGPMTICKFKDVAGNVFVWKTSSTAGLDVSKTYQIKGTVMKHTEYKYVKQTQLNRCVVVGQPTVV